MRRRDFISLFGGTAAALPLAARAQQSAGDIARVGVLNAGLDNPLIAAGYPAFLAELQKHGFTEGQNLIIEHRRIDKEQTKTFAAAAELIQSKVDVLVASGPETSLKAAIAASRTIPIVMIAGDYDPIARGYVSSLAHPGGNITGLYYRQPELAPKQLEYFVESFPDKKPVTVMWDSASADEFNVAKRTAESMHLELGSHELENPPYDFDAAFSAIVQDGTQMLLVLSSSLFAPQRSHIAELAIHYRLPTMFKYKFFVEAGGLMSYGTDVVPIWRRAGSDVAKILRGAKPSDLPIERPNNFEFVVNLKTAKAIGVTFPTSILLRADEVIE
jgi:ABC-type uncharacterized transport system substrate-binding protein